MEPPKIIPVKDPTEVDDRFKDIHPHLPNISGYGGGACVLLLAPVKCGKCVGMNTLIETKGLGYIKIKNIKIGQYVNSENGYVLVNDVFDQGVKNCSKIIINNNELVLTQDHKLQTSDGMKSLKNIKDELIITKNGKYQISKRIDNFINVHCYDLQVDHLDHTFYGNNISISNSTIINNLLLNTDFYDAQNNFDDTYVISNTISNDITSRFLKDAFDVYDQYDDRTVSDIIKYQKGFDKVDQPQCAIVIDDCLGSIKREAKVNHLASRFRHYGIRLLIFSSQKFTGSVSPIIRTNATNVIVGSPFPNRRELGKIAEEYGDLFGGQDQFLKLYQYATPNRYDFIHMDLQSNPPLMYKNFDEVISVGEKPMVPLNGIKGDLFEDKNKNIVEQ